jgi:CRISPR system Cascade subunit CasB
MSTTLNQSRGVEPFVRSLIRLFTEEDRAALAALRRALGKQPGEAAEAHRYVLPFVAPGMKPWDENAYYLVGALFALHPANWGPPEEQAEQQQATTTNMGASFRRLAGEVESGSVERRFVALLNSHPDDLPEHLRHAVGLLKSKEVPVNWSQLIHDLRNWNHEARWVQRNWARAFWGQPSDQDNTIG